MKQRRLLCTFFIIILLVLSACNNNGKTDKVSGDKVDTSNNLPTVEGESPQPKSDLAQDETKAILGTNMNDSGSLVALDSLVGGDSSNIIISGFYNDKQLLVIENINFEKIHVFLYNIYTGKIEKETEIPKQMDSIEYVVMDNGNIFIQDVGYNFYYIFDSHLTLVESSDDKVFEYDTILASKDGKKLFYTSSDLKQIFCYDRESKKSELLWENNGEGKILTLQDISENNAALIASYSEGEKRWGNMIITLEDKKVTYIEEPEYSICLENNQYILSSYELSKQGMIEVFDPLMTRKITRFLFEDPSETDYYKFNKEASQVFTICNGKDAVNENENSLEFKLYDLESGNKVKQDGFEKEALEATVQEDETGIMFFGNNYLSYSLDNSKVCVNYYLNNKSRIVIWDLALAEKIVSGSEKKEFFYENSEVTQYGNDLIKDELEKEYDITIHLREDAVRFFPDFAVVPSSDETLINEGLKELKLALAKYPKDFFKDFTYGDIEGFEIFLCSRLVQGSEYGISYPAAFALTYDNKQMIVLDINSTYSIETNFAHETMHAIDSKISYLIINDKISPKLSEKWAKLNPKKFEYHWSYVNEIGEEYSSNNSSKYTPDDPKSASNVNNVYFIDYYSTTFPIEDRARIFETLMIADNELPSCFESEKLRAKAHLLSQMIRESLSCMESVDEACWEKYIK